KEDRTIDFLKKTVNKIYDAFLTVDKKLYEKHKINRKLPEKITFISSQELHDLYPDLSPDQRETEFVKMHKAIFVYKLGHKLIKNEEFVQNGSASSSDLISEQSKEKKQKFKDEFDGRHCIRAPDYDDWTLNGDIIFYHQVLDCAIEMSSMGIRVDSVSLKLQLKESKTDLTTSEYHDSVLTDRHFTIGGGIGQSRTFMFFLEETDIRGVQGETAPFVNNK
ncbi:aspartate--ammonia ligase, partial [Pseudoloma neurophilia]